MKNKNNTEIYLNTLRTFVLLIFVMPIKADELIVITNPATEVVTMTQTDVANLFLDKGQNHHQTPYDQEDTQLREQFYRDVTNLSLASVRAYWAKRVFTGRGRPPAILKQDEVQQVLKVDPSAVTYTSEDHQPQGTRILFTSGSGEQK